MALEVYRYETKYAILSVIALELLKLFICEF